jgi:hypothetical protein
MSVRSFISVAAVAAATVTVVSADASVIVSDGTFLDSNWTMVSRGYGPGGGSGTGEQLLAGGAGDNGPARQTSNFAGANNSGSYNASIYTAFSYNPAASGPLTNLSISIDARSLNGLSSMGAVVEQSGLIWFAGYVLNTPNWQTYTFTPVAGDWFLMNPSGGELGPGPDFSVAGAPMRFGFYTANGTGPGGFPYTRVGRNDNFVVSFIPTPGAAMVLGLGGLVAARRRR